jgi:protein SCO1
MNLFKLFLVILICSVAALSGCESSALDDYTDVTFNLVDQNGQDVVFPDDFQGQPMVLGFVYTNCPDICSFITANLYKSWVELDEPDDIQFVIATFDPERDTPEVLKNYAEAFNMDRPPFRFLTGAEDEIEAFMQRVGVRSQVSYTREIENGDELYFLNHTDKILLIDQNSRLIMDYGGSMTPTHIITEDLQKL